MPPIVLLTDFGQQDGFVGVMKGVIAGLAPQAPVIDLTHDLPPQDLDAARFVLWNSFRHFPPESLFVCVVDPGVGSKRDIWALQTEQHVFLAPDNGLLDYVMAEVPVRQLFRVDNPVLFKQPLSTTFHGRDIFAPVAARLASGFPLTQVGPLIDYRLPESPFLPANEIPSCKGRVLHIDHFGNLITNLRIADAKQGSVRVGNRTLVLFRAYADVNSGEALALKGSHGLLEISIRDGHAARAFGAAIGTPVILDCQGGR